MLTPEENALLTEIGPGTPAGNLLRHYWYPIATAGELSADHPTHFVRLLGEDLVLFQDGSGRVGLIQDHCPHRGCSLLYGRVEERGIACAYHGWLYDTTGSCLETPAEPAGSMFHLTVKATAYPVQLFVGLYWAYLGPNPVPAIPHLDLWVRKDGHRKIYVQPQLDCNWFAAMENSVDPAHSRVLHSVGSALRAGRPANTTRGATDEVEYFDFSETAIGIMKKRVSRNGHVDEHPLVFPNILRHGNDTHIRVPMDDTHTRIYFVNFIPSPDGAAVEEDDASLETIFLEDYKAPTDRLHPFTRFTMHNTQPEDHMAWETQGPTADRTHERLATSDRGIVMLRQMLRREIDKVAEGMEPINVYHDPAHPRVDTNHDAQMVEWARNAARRGAGVATGR
ncbi:MAG: 5,5-dehydrodivanillate O-demethylase oxygenase subunit [Chloroflexota bacterium]|nr:5,5-dehydrodivanillate O-demethylase oxygenase subunit [Chloroflexota bacterium]